ncbi:MAG: cytochrome d ubiquinol oxidase subunit II [Bacteroidales bacterium]|jgi:cytochrome d ubiquinol oxidase subunit II|nr:cytochrome d ubiquinol oxidase subunit II [Bacteroidales bacterium]
MFGSYEFLQHYWWIIVSLLGALFVFLTFVQGGQTLLYQVARTDTERDLVVNVLGRKWEFTFTTLVTFGGAFFAAFPLFYSTSFGGAYWVWLSVLLFFVIQAVAYEFRRKPANLLGARTYEMFLLLNGALGTILIGVAVGTFFNGAMFKLDEMNHVIWQTNLRGLEAALDFKRDAVNHELIPDNIHNIALGLAIFFLARILGALYFINTVDDDEIERRSRKQVLYNAVPFLIFFLFFVIRLMLIEGFAVNDSGGIENEPYKYWHNLVQMPLVALLFTAGVTGVLWGIGITWLRNSDKGIWFAGTGTILVVFSVFLLAGFNNTAFYPSRFDLQSSLTLQKAASSKFTLTTMSYVSLAIPFVLAYIWWFWKVMTRDKITTEEIEDDPHAY